MANFTMLWSRRGRHPHHHHIRTSSPPKHRPYLLPSVATLCVFIFVIRAAFLSPAHVNDDDATSTAVNSKSKTAKSTERYEYRCKLDSADMDTSPRKQPPTRIFVHLHKCGGNNLKIALEGFSHKNHLRHWHTCHPSMRDTFLERIYFSRRIKNLNGTDCNLKPFVRLPRLQRRSYDLVYGHQYVGIHDAIYPRKAEYFTILRHPLMRKVSHYSHFELRGSININSNSNRNGMNQYLLYRNRNYMTKRLSTKTLQSEIGTDFRSKLIDNNKHASRAALKAAIDNLRHKFIFVGIHERYAESVCVLTRILNSACYSRAPNGISTPLKARRIYRNHINTNTERGGTATDKIVSSLPASVVRGTMVAEKLDTILYEYAVRKFEKMLKRYPECTLASLRARERRRGR